MSLIFKISPYLFLIHILHFEVQALMFALYFTGSINYYVGCAFMNLFLLENR
jgi:hypothetical protein